MEAAGRARRGLAPLSTSTGQATELTWRSAAELARMIAAGEASSVEVVGAHVARIKDVNGKLNAVILPRFEEAMAEAKAADEKRARGERLGRLHGVPMTCKECYDLAGLPNTGGGLKWLADKKSTADAPMVSNLRKAGAVFMGKTNMPHVMLFNEGDNPLYGRTNNPWDLERTPGGGSSGEGAIIAAGGSPLGLATDYGGSVRIPPDFCGVQGFRPTYGRFTMRGTFDVKLFPGLETPIDQPGIMARDVADIELAFLVLREGGSGEDEHTMLPRPWLETDDVSLKGLRVGYYEQDHVYAAAPVKRRAVREAAKALADRGADVVEFMPPDIEHGRNLFLALMSAGGHRWVSRLTHGEWLDKRAGHLAEAMRLPRRAVPSISLMMRGLGQDSFASYMSLAGRRSTADYWELVLERDRYRDAYLAALSDARIDVIVCPSNPFPAYRHGANYWLGVAHSYTHVYNLLCVPCGHVTTTTVHKGEESDRKPSRDVTNRAARETERGSAGLPAGVQVVGRYWREDQVLAVMRALDADSRRRPDYPGRPPV